MAYYKGKDIEKSRGNAMKELILEKRSVAQVARRFGENNPYTQFNPQDSS